MGKDVGHFFPVWKFLPGIGTDVRVASSSKESAKALAHGLLTKGVIEEETPTFSLLNKILQTVSGRSVSTPGGYI